ncbi:hypothetical protein GGS20DRAFT_7138 [Poronia punctata]|nr:hypothetical protein GGS20DRAFT_7138 [Poronia punctata]
MSSSTSKTTALSRTRSLRQPAGKSNDEPFQSQDKPRNESRTASPSRLPTTTMRTTRSTTAATSARTTTTSSSSSSTTAARTTSRTGAGAGPSSSSSRLISSTRAPSSSKPKPLGRAPSVRRPPSTTTTSTTTSTSGGRAVSGPTRPASSASSTTTTISDTTRERVRLGQHARAKSTVTSLTSATTLRPQQQQQQQQQQTRSQTQTQTQQRRIPSQTTGTGTTTTTTTLAPRRPAFNTNQQHYSPAKQQHVPKPLTSTFLAPPSPSKQPVNIALSSETSRLQTELLQLSLLHRSAHSVTNEWHVSAREKLRSKFEELARTDEALRGEERDGAEERGMGDLITWGGKGEGKGLDRKVQILDQVLNGLWILGDSGGRFSRVVREFETWAGKVGAILAAQRFNEVDTILSKGGKDGDDDATVIFVSDLDSAGWKGDHAGLLRVLEGWGRMLETLGDFDGQQQQSQHQQQSSKKSSGLARTLQGCRSLVRDMLSELRFMEEMERDALVAEENWMAGMEMRLRAEEEEEERDGGQRGRVKMEADLQPWKAMVF